jgi:hypothetical protein
MPRENLLASYNALKRTIDDNGGNIAAMDDFTTRALDMITTPRARDAFDIGQEPENIRALYGRWLDSGDDERGYRTVAHEADLRKCRFGPNDK